MDILDSFFNKPPKTNQSNFTTHLPSFIPHSHHNNQYQTNNSIDNNIPNHHTNVSISRQHQTKHNQSTPNSRRPNRNPDFGESIQSGFLNQNISLYQSAGVSNNIMNSDIETGSNILRTQSHTQIKQNERGRRASKAGIQHSLGVILSDQGQQSNGNKNKHSIIEEKNLQNFSFVKDGNIGLNMTQTQSKLLPNSHIARSHLKQGQNQIFKFQEMQEQIKKYKQNQEDLKSKLQTLQKSKQNEISQLRRKLQDESVRKIKELVEESQQESRNTKQRLKRLFEEEISSKEAIYKWEIQNLKNNYEHQISGLKDSVATYKELLTTHSAIIQQASLQQPCQASRVTIPKPNTEGCKQLKRKLSDMYDQFYREKLEQQQKLEKQSNNLARQREQFLTIKNQENRHLLEKQQRINKELNRRQRQLDKRETQLTKKQQQMLLMEAKIDAKNIATDKHSKKVYEALEVEQKKIMEENNRLKQLEIQLLEKIRVVELYNQKKPIQNHQQNMDNEESSIKQNQPCDLKEGKSQTNILKTLKDCQENKQIKQTALKNNTSHIKSTKYIAKPRPHEHKLNNYLGSLKNRSLMKR